VDVLPEAGTWGGGPGKTTRRTALGSTLWRKPLTDASSEPVRRERDNRINTAFLRECVTILDAEALEHSSENDFCEERSELPTLGTPLEDLPNGQRCARSELELTFRQILVAVDFANQENMKMIGRPGGKE
jgi:hypothetical protein